MSHEKKPYATSFSGKGVFPAKYAFTLLIPLRNFFLSPKTLLKRLALKQEFQVLEIGSGPGYFSTSIAKALPNGRLVLADIQQAMLDYAQKRLNARNLNNVDYVLCNGNSFPFNDHYFDRVVMVSVIGEVENQKDYLKEIHRMLKDTGILSISELAGDPDKFEIEDLKTLVCSAGFEVQEVFGNKRNYTVNFTKNASLITH